MTPEQLEESDTLRIDFTRFRRPAGVGIVPVAVQDADSKEVLLVGHASAEALDYTLTHRVAAFWSVSRNELWVKGETSRNRLDLVEVRVNCEQNSLLYLVSLARGGRATRATRLALRGGRATTAASARADLSMR